MINKVDIYVENMKLDVDNIDLAITYSFSELSNPQDITGDYSKTITIKGTQNNNAVFGQVWRFDRMIITNATKNSGIYFNASKRANCVIYINGQIFKRGYLKLNAVNMNAGVISYDVTFYSTLCSVLHALQEKKLIDLSFMDDVKHTINRSTIYNSWQNFNYFDDFCYVPCNNGLYNNFNNSQMITYLSGAFRIIDVAGGLDLDECAKGEYRSYYQRPAFKVKSIIDGIVDDYNTDNNLEEGKMLMLRGNFWQSENPYYASSVLTMPQYNLDDKETNYIGVGIKPYGSGALVGTSTANEGLKLDIPLKFNASLDGIFEGDTIINLGEITGTCDINVELEIGMTFNIVNQTDLNNVNVGSVLTPLFSHSICMITAGLYVDNGDGTYGFIQNLIPYTINDSTLKIACAQVISKTSTIANAECYFRNPYTGYKPLGMFGEFIPKLPVHFHTNSKVLPSNDYCVIIRFSRCYSMGMRIDASSSKSLISNLYNFTLYPISKPANPETSFDVNNYWPAYGINYENGFTGNDITIINNEQIQTDSTIKKSLMIDNETTQADFLINYTKMFGLLYDTDVNGNVVIKSRNKFFEDYKVLDWESKIDYSKSIIQTPITFENKYIQFNYKEGETYYETYYKNKFNVDYGAMKINTGYQFNDNTKELTENNIFMNTICSKERTKMMIGSQLVMANDEKTLPALFKMENNYRNQSDSKYNLLFYNGQQTLTNSVIISDDMEQMYDESIDNGGEPCWLDATNETVLSWAGRRTSNIPIYDRVTADGKYSWDLGYPRENYADLNSQKYKPSSTIYNNFWKSYIEEIYNVDNKIVKCRVRLTPIDMCQFSFRNFVKVFNCLWHVNKINNYNPLNDAPTEVELIKVTNIDGYINSQKEFYREYDITLNLTGLSSMNPARTVYENSSYFTELVPATPNYILGCTVTMGGRDITSDVWDESTLSINIPKVIGNIVVTAAATSV